jgi:hypothetical protein
VRRIGDRHDGVWHVYLAESDSFYCPWRSIRQRYGDCLGKYQAGR